MVIGRNRPDPTKKTLHGDAQHFSAALGVRVEPPNWRSMWPAFVLDRAATARATLREGLAVSAFPLCVPV
jgi:hypothetical protein